MKIPRWLLFVVAGVAALAVGVAAVLIGMRFAPAPAASAFVPPGTEVSQVIAPVAVDDGDDGDAGSASAGTDSSGETGTGPAIGTAAGDDEDQPAPSPVIAEEDVAVPEDDPAVTDLELLRLVDLIGRDPDLFSGLFTLDLGGRDDDPCAPASGTPGDDCPAGIPGAVFINDEIPPLWLNPIAFPHTHAQLHNLPARTLPASLYCDIAVDNTDATSTVEVPLRIRSSVPGNWTVRYWPTGDEGAALELTVPAATEQQINDYQTDLDRPEDDWFAPEQCISLPDVLAAVPYTAVVTGEDFLGRPAPAATVLFNSGGEPGHPSLQLRTVGQNLLIASAAHTAGEDVLFQAYLLPYDSGIAAATCTPSFAGQESFSPTTSAVDSPIDAAGRLELNVTDDNTLSDYVSYRVPEGASLLICARWYPAGDHVPTWESAQATYESSAFVQTANRLLPKLVMTDFQARTRHGGGLGVILDIRVNTAEGIECARTHFERDEATPFPVCDPSALATGGATVDGDRLADRGFTGDLVLRIDAQTVAAPVETSETTVTLPAGEGSCIGMCPAVAPQTFQVATIAGTATFVETWEQGRFNPNSEAWSLSPTVSNPIDYVQPDVPQIDTDAEWHYTGAGIASGVANATLTLPVDRHVQWTLTTGGALNCATTPVPPGDSGESVSDVINISLTSLCLGQDYAASLRLVDDAGHVAVWSVASSTNRWIPNGVIIAPFVNVTLRYRVDAAGTYNQYLQNYGIWLNGTVYPLVNQYASPAGSQCLRDDGLIMSEGRFDTSLGSHLDLGLVVRLVPRRDVAPGADYGCGGYFVDERVTPAVVATLPLSDFSSAGGVQLTIPGQRDTLHVWLDPRH
jgi:hypothetical protein